MRIFISEKIITFDFNQYNLKRFFALDEMNNA
jgi:hypothetical protein